MINGYWIFSEDIFEEKYAVEKFILKADFLVPIVQKSLIFEYQFCIIVDLFSQKEDAKSGNYNNIDEYKKFLKCESLETFQDNPPEKFYFGAYAQRLDKIELDYFIKNWKKKQSGYLYPKVYDAETKEELPAYFILLFDYVESEFNGLRGFEIPETEAEIISILFGNQIYQAQRRYEFWKILNFDYPYSSICSLMQKFIATYLKNEVVDVKSINEIMKELEEIKDIGVRKFLLYILNSFIKELENKKLFKSCRHCNVLFEYLEIKKYCCEDCKIKSKNKRYYSKNSNVIKKKKVLK